MATRHEEGRCEKNILKRFHVCKGLSNDDVGAARGTVVKEIRRGADFKSGYFSLKKSWGGLPRRTSQFIVVLCCCTQGVRDLQPLLGFKKCKNRQR